MNLNGFQITVPSKKEEEGSIRRKRDSRTGRLVLVRIPFGLIGEQAREPRVHEPDTLIPEDGRELLERKMRQIRGEGASRGTSSSGGGATSSCRALQR